jgi:hypothetical protein
MLKRMARMALKCVLAGLLAVMAAQGAAPCARIVTAIAAVCTVETACRADTEQRARYKVQGVRATLRFRRQSARYVSPTRPAPDRGSLFQRPPPTAFLFA